MKKRYKAVYDAYTRIFRRVGLRFRAVAADNGEIGGTGSHEFQVLTGAGEDAIAYSAGSDYAANVELAEALAPSQPRSAPSQPMKKVATPNKHTCEEVSELLGIPIEKTVKSIVVMRDPPKDAPPGSTPEMTMLLVRGDHMLNEVKTSKIAGMSPFRFATEAEIRARLNAPPGSLGPTGHPGLRVIADRTVAAMTDFVTGANEAGFHLPGRPRGPHPPAPPLPPPHPSVSARLPHPA